MTLEEAVAYLKEEDLATMAVGTYEVDGDFYFMIQEYETKEVADCRLETHKNYTDIQWIISGEEAIDTVNVAGLTVEEAYDADRDVAFGRNLQKCAIWYYLPVPTRSCHRASHINLACVQEVRHPRSKNVWERCAFTNYQTSPGYFRFQSLRTFVMISMTSLDWARRMMLSSPERMASSISFIS